MEVSISFLCIWIGKRDISEVYLDDLKKICTDAGIGYTIHPSGYEHQFYLSNSVYLPVRSEETAFLYEEIPTNLAPFDFNYNRVCQFHLWELISPAQS